MLYHNSCLPPLPPPRWLYIVSWNKNNDCGPEFAAPAAEGVTTAGAGLPPADGITAASLFFFFFTNVKFSFANGAKVKSVAKQHADMGLRAADEILSLPDVKRPHAASDQSELG